MAPIEIVLIFIYSYFILFIYYFNICNNVKLKKWKRIHVLDSCCNDGKFQQQFSNNYNNIIQNNIDFSLVYFVWCQPFHKSLRETKHWVNLIPFYLQRFCKIAKSLSFSLCSRFYSFTLLSGKTIIFQQNNQIF